MSEIISNFNDSDSNKKGQITKIYQLFIIDRLRHSKKLTTVIRMIKDIVIDEKVGNIKVSS